MSLRDWLHYVYTVNHLKVLAMIKIGVLLAALGLIALVAFRLVGARVDAEGILREPFALLPIGLLFLVAGAMIALAGVARHKVLGPS